MSIVDSTEMRSKGFASWIYFRAESIIARAKSSRQAERELPYPPSTSFNSSVSVSVCCGFVCMISRQNTENVAIILNDSYDESKCTNACEELCS